MTVADIALGFNAMGDWMYRIERWFGVQILAFIDDAVDTGRWLRRAWLRRRERRPGAHRTEDRSLRIWDIYHRMTDEELAKSGWKLVREPGVHRDQRGWRYAPATWKQIPVWEGERKRAEAELAEAVYWDRTVEQLIADIQYMLANPPEPLTLHGCKHCLCAVPA